MLKRVMFFLLLSSGLFLTSCGNQQPAEQQAEATEEASEAMSEAPEAMGEWDQLMDAYHDVMSGTFHPAEEGDLAPLKERYKELAERSTAWAAVAIPEKHQGKELETMMTTLQAESKAIGALVESGASDEDLNKAIVALHDVYHGIVGACMDEH